MSEPKRNPRIIWSNPVTGIGGQIQVLEALNDGHPIRNAKTRSKITSKNILRLNKEYQIGKIVPYESTWVAQIDREFYFYADKKNAVNRLSNSSHEGRVFKMVEIDDE